MFNFLLCLTTDLRPNTQRYYNSLLLCRLTNMNTWLFTFSTQPFKVQSTHSHPGNYSNQMSTSAPFHNTSCISYVLKIKSSNKKHTFENGCAHPCSKL